MIKETPTVTLRTIVTTGAELVVEDNGRDEPALIFLHYWGGSSRTWTPVMARLPASLRVVALNQRGWGGSRPIDGRYDLDALADDVTAVVAALGIGRYILAGHSMGGKVAQIAAGRRPPGLLGLMLVAPAPPTPMQVPADVRAGMLASYQSQAGVLQALQVLAGPGLDDKHRGQIVEDTLRGDAPAKRMWPEHGMAVDVGAAARRIAVPVDILLGEHDQVERATVLRPLFAGLLPQASVTVVPGAGHLLPLEAPEAIASRLEHLLAVTGAMERGAKEVEP